MGLFNLWEEFVWKKVLSMPKGFKYPWCIFFFGSLCGGLQGIDFMLKNLSGLGRVHPAVRLAWALGSLLLVPLQVFILRILLSLSEINVRPVADVLYRFLDHVYIYQEETKKGNETDSSANSAGQSLVKLDARKEEHFAVIIACRNGVKKDKVNVEPKKEPQIKTVCNMPCLTPQYIRQQSEENISRYSAAENRQASGQNKGSAAFNGIAGASVRDQMQNEADSLQAKTAHYFAFSGPYSDCIERNVQDNPGCSMTDLVEKAGNKHCQVNSCEGKDSEQNEPSYYIRVRHFTLSLIQKILIISVSPVWLTDFLVNGWRRPFQPTCGMDFDSYLEDYCYFLGGEMWMFFYAFLASMLFAGVSASAISGF